MKPEYAALKPTILLIEDNPAHAELVKRQLESFQPDSRVYHISNGEAALNYLFRQEKYADPSASPRPHIILLDLRLPRVDGLTVLQQIKSSEELSVIPVIILSTSAAEHDVDLAYQWHANSYLVKPDNFTHFTQLMRKLSTYWLGLNQLPSV